MFSLWSFVVGVVVADVFWLIVLPVVRAVVEGVRGRRS